MSCSLVASAQAVADGMRHGEMTHAHLANVLLDRPEVVVLLDRHGIDASGIVARNQRELERLGASTGRLAQVSVGLLVLLRRAQKRAGASGLRPGDLVTALAEDASEALGEALRDVPLVVPALGAWLDAVDARVETTQEALLFHGLGREAMMAIALGQRVAQRAGSAQVLPLHVLAAITETHAANAVKLGLADGGAPATACRELLDRLPKRATGDPNISLALLAFAERVATMALPGHVAGRSALFNALRLERGWPFGETLRWFASFEHDIVSRVEQAAFKRVTAVLDRTDDYGAISIVARDAGIRLQVYDFGGGQGLGPTRLLDVGPERTLSVRCSEDARDVEASRAAFALLKAVAGADVAACRDALERAGYVDVTSTEEPVQPGGLACAAIGATLDGRRLGLKLYTYGHCASETLRRTRGASVEIAVPTRSRQLDMAAFEKLSEALSSSNPDCGRHEP